ncbi:hypothetical protein C8Q75DRAFT_725475 [Abortiporus biennis]|nr:hypothetical protein C8Q75DRAFT_725475 [Abortiporus biennis]
MFKELHIESSPKRIRVLFAGHFVADTKQAKLVWLKPSYPYYFFEEGVIDKKYLIEAFHSEKHQVYDLVVATTHAKGVVTQYLEGELKGLFNIEFGAPDAWFEEDEQIYVHPKDPYKRVDVLQSSRHIRIELDGVELANTKRPRLLFETSLPVRSYIPKTDCHLELFESSKLTTQCPYKGVANYYSIKLPNGRVAEDIVWYYRTPLLECAEVKGCVAFYDEKVDVYVDGVLQRRPGSG